MNSASVAALRSLRSVEVSAAQTGNALLSLLGTIGKAALADFDLAPDYWFVSDANSAFAVAVDGIVVSAADLDLACDALDAAEPLLQQSEALLGVALDPLDLKPKAQIMADFSTALVARIDSPATTLWIALHPDAGHIAQWQAKADSLPVDPATVPIPVMVTLTAARLTPEQAAGMAPGDLLLLARHMPAMLAAVSQDKADPVGGRFDCQSGAFSAGAVFDDGDADMQDDDLEPSGAAAAFAVPVTLRLPGHSIDAATLAALGPGYVLPLSPLVQGLQVDLLVGGRRIARGEIVELGDNFAVHIDERITQAGAKAAPEPAMEDDA